MSTMETHRTHSGPMNPAGRQATSFEAWQALVAPGDMFRHPREVLAHPHLTREDKRAVLASWASNACALEDAPGLRCLTGSKAEPVPADAVLDVLARLDATHSATWPRHSPRRRPRAPSKFRRYLRPRRNDDSDDPPPSPATVMPRPPLPLGAAGLALRLPA